MLKEITNKTFSKLLKEDIVLPSNYYETFDNFAKEYKINSEKKIHNSIDDLVKDEIKKLHELTDKTLQNMEIFVEFTDQAGDAIDQKDTRQLRAITKEIKTLQSDMEFLLSEIYKDDLTNLYNKKWIYKKLLDNEDRFKNNGNLYLIQIDNLDYIKKEYGELVASNIIRFIAKLINTKIEHNTNEYNFCRYLEDKLILTHNYYHHAMEDMIKEMQHYIENSTLKSQSGLMIKASFSYSKSTYKAKDSFHDLLESLDTKLLEK